MDKYDILDDIRGTWIVLDYLRYDGDKKDHIYLIQCECGRTEECSRKKWKHPNRFLCFCRYENKYIGMRIGMLTITQVDKTLPSKRGRYGVILTARCDCGNVKTMRINGDLHDYKSCGCIVKEQAKTLHLYRWKRV